MKNIKAKLIIFTACLIAGPLLVAYWQQLATPVKPITAEEAETANSANSCHSSRGRSLRQIRGASVEAYEETCKKQTIVNHSKKSGLTPAEDTCGLRGIYRWCEQRRPIFIGAVS